MPAGRWGAPAVGGTCAPGIALLQSACTRPTPCGRDIAAALDLAGHPAPRDMTDCGRTGALGPAVLPSRLGTDSPCMDRTATVMTTEAPWRWNIVPDPGTARTC
ncbi:hypothetical protein NDU88_007508 [Pleurodeles waltl]|uniref:Uncharacterized protein n=1 Tax=Pleurodeles waltl TaxID=8319 RepID=A0AAV7LTW1_PLEWA|nr:hypothetical protein NDU88_007508 [Pleurodeles waltl]